MLAKKIIYVLTFSFVVILFLFSDSAAIAAPPPGVLDQAQGGYSTESSIAGNFYCAQTFTAGNFSNPGNRFLVNVVLRIRRNGNPSNNFVVEIRNVSDNMPGSTVYGTASKAPGSISTTFTDYNFSFSNLTVISGTKYAIVCYTTGDDVGYCYDIRYNASNPYTSGELCLSINRGTSWSGGTTDLYFQTYIAHFESYKEADHLNLWGASGTPYGTDSQTVYIGGSGFGNSIQYHIGYYDLMNERQSSETVTSGPDGSLSGAYLCSTHPDAPAGTWHAAAYRSAPPDTFNPDDADIVLQDEFTVNQSAIPEFPAVTAAIGVICLCFGIYFRMRKKLLCI